ncbi:hypothetical protein E3U44_16065 [Nitrosococcus wardiae]|uniref:Uncharacterized protein n=1 Tax=Nitrosococcus wardiae TaxID=1814290 RepID=A0A4P7C2B1_9GAMM|nr:hypothetical protein E3U44_16065 [Nitrosococcus wardiae]
MTTGFRLSEPNTATTACHAALALRLRAPLRFASSLGGRRASLHFFKAVLKTYSPGSLTIVSQKLSMLLTI